MEQVGGNYEEGFLWFIIVEGRAGAEACLLPHPPLCMTVYANNCQVVLVNAPANTHTATYIRDTSLPVTLIMQADC